MAVSQLFACLTYALFALRDIFPDVLTIPLANTTGILIGVSRLQATREFFGKTDQGMSRFLLAMLTLPVFYYFTFTWDDIVIRNLLFSVIIVIITLRHAWVLYQNRRKSSRTIVLFMIGLMLSFSLLFILRTVYWTIFPELRGMLLNSSSNAVSYLLSLFFDVSWAVSFILLNNHRLNAEIKELGRKLAQLSQGIEQSPTSVVITDLLGRIEYVNPHFSELTGYSRDEVMGKAASIQKSGQTPNETYREMWETIQSGSPWRGEFVNRKKNGDLYWEAVVMSPVKDEDGNIFNFIAVKEDITARKDAETALRESETKLRAANQELETRLEKITVLEAELREQSIRDPLTGLYNRRYLNETIEREFEKSRSANQPISIILFDFDHFKSVNDTYGHLTGDACLKSIANLLQQFARKADIVCRYGGEEFLVLLPDASLEFAAQRAEELRKVFESNPFVFGDKQFHNTVSMGVAALRKEENPAEVIHRADQALYAAKMNGRNRVVVWDSMAHQ